MIKYLNKTWAVLCLLLLLMPALTGCDNDTATETKEETETDNGTPFEAAVSGIEGTWEVSEIRDFYREEWEVWEYPDEYGDQVYFQFKEGVLKDYYFSAHDDTLYLEFTLNYTLDGNEISIDDNYETILLRCERSL